MDEMNEKNNLSEIVLKYRDANVSDHLKRIISKYIQRRYPETYGAILHGGMKEKKKNISMSEYTVQDYLMLEDDTSDHTKIITLKISKNAVLNVDRQQYNLLLHGLHYFYPDYEKPDPNWSYDKFWNLVFKKDFDQKLRDERKKNHIEYLFTEENGKILDEYSKILLVESKMLPIYKSDKSIEEKIQTRENLKVDLHDIKQTVDELNKNLQENLEMYERKKGQIISKHMQTVEGLMNSEYMNSESDSVESPVKILIDAYDPNNFKTPREYYAYIRKNHMAQLHNDDGNDGYGYMSFIAVLLGETGPNSEIIVTPERFEDIILNYYHIYKSHAILKNVNHRLKKLSDNRIKEVQGLTAIKTQYSEQIKEQIKDNETKMAEIEGQINSIQEQLNDPSLYHYLNGRKMQHTFQCLASDTIIPGSKNPKNTYLSWQKKIIFDLIKDKEVIKNNNLFACPCDKSHFLPIKHTGGENSIKFATCVVVKSKTDDTLAPDLPSLHLPSLQTDYCANECCDYFQKTIDTSTHKCERNPTRITYAALIAELTNFIHGNMNNPFHENHKNGTIDVHGNDSLVYCPHCYNFPIQRSDGCNYIKCPNAECGKHFCFHCATPLDSEAEFTERNKIHYGTEGVHRKCKVLKDFEAGIALESGDGQIDEQDKLERASELKDHYISNQMKFVTNILGKLQDLAHNIEYPLRNVKIPEQVVDEISGILEKSHLNHLTKDTIGLSIFPESQVVT